MVKNGLTIFFNGLDSWRKISGSVVRQPARRLVNDDKLCPHYLVKMWKWELSVPSLFKLFLTNLPAPWLKQAYFPFQMTPDCFCVHPCLHWYALRAAEIMWNELCGVLLESRAAQTKALCKWQGRAVGGQHLIVQSELHLLTTIIILMESISRLLSL